MALAACVSAPPPAPPDVQLPPARFLLTFDDGPSAFITFHDTNTFTASHLQEHLRILLEESQQVGLPIATPPFYNGAEEIEQAALLRAQAGLYAGPP